MTRSPSPTSSPRSSPTPSPSSSEASRPGEAAVEDGRQLLEKLQEDRLWLLRQLDAGRWPEWRLDLAALERELGQLLDQAGEQID
ncbi:MAG: hypothetical protein VKO26_09620 [Cyanobacteriota bacterium]|nr:hypothetical protein [Cyanobacteriota bacterium]